jgi:hypothetical protein
MTKDDNNDIDEIRMINIILNNVHNSYMLVVVDICHSGSFFNLPYKYVADR